MLITFENLGPGIQQCRIDLNKLYADKHDRAQFENRWPAFYRSDESHAEVYSREEKDVITYRSESFVPVTTDSRPPLLLLLGNPASHSVASGMCFAFEGKEGKEQEHRFWIALREAKLLDFNDMGDSVPLSLAERNCRRRSQLFDLSYSSPYRIGITMFYSLPSPASNKEWSGVNGIRKLLGREAMNEIAEVEQQRVAQLVQSYMPKGGGMMVFQRDAYEAVRQMTDPQYSLDLAKMGQLVGTYRRNPNVVVMGVAPTRYMLSSKARDSLARCASRLAATPRVSLRQ